MEITTNTSPEDWSFFAKGAANILFKYSGSNNYLKHKLLRLRLKKAENEYISTCQLYDFIELKCKPLFPQQIIDVHLVVLTTEFVSALDCEDHALMLSEQYGLLIPNILCGNFEKQTLSKYSSLYVGTSLIEAANGIVDTVILEMKPKWLYDNSSNYCRTCLLNQAKGYRRHFCPLDFLYPETIEEGLQDLIGLISGKTRKLIEVQNGIPFLSLLRVFVEKEGNVFQKLKTYQEVENESDFIVNLKSQDDVLERLSLIMTLRDVGLFIKCEKFDESNDVHKSQINSANIVVIEGEKFLLTSNIYDLDLKSKLKYKHWIAVEEKLKEIYNSNNPDWRFCVKKNSFKYT